MDNQMAEALFDYCYWKQRKPVSRSDRQQTREEADDRTPVVLEAEAVGQGTSCRDLVERIRREPCWAFAEASSVVRCCIPDIRVAFDVTDKDSVPSVVDNCLKKIYKKFNFYNSVIWTKSISRILCHCAFALGGYGAAMWWGDLLCGYIWFPYAPGGGCKCCGIVRFGDWAGLGCWGGWPPIPPPPLATAPPLPALGACGDCIECGPGPMPGVGCCEDDCGCVGGGVELGTCWGGVPEEAEADCCCCAPPLPPALFFLFFEAELPELLRGGILRSCFCFWQLNKWPQMSVDNDEEEEKEGKEDGCGALWTQCA